jgi:hypothetical protein
LRIDLSEALKDFVEGQKIVHRRFDVIIGGRQWNPLSVSSMLNTASTPRAVDENPSHGLGRHDEKVLAICKPMVPREPQIGFVDQRGGIERKTGVLAR